MLRKPRFESLESKDLLTAFLAEDTSIVPRPFVRSEPVSFGGSTYFVGSTLDNPLELWKTDGTPLGTHVVPKATVDSRISPPPTLWAEVVRAGDRLVYFETLQYGDYDPWAIWSTDGGALNRLGTVSGSLESYTEYDGGVAFSIAPPEAISQNEILWTDGVELKTLIPRTDDILSIENVSGTLLIYHNDRVHKYENGELLDIERVDGRTNSFVWNDNLVEITEYGELILREAPDFEPVTLIEFEEESVGIVRSLTRSDVLFFSVGLEDAELWQTDGTPEGTHRVAVVGDYWISGLETIGDNTFIKLTSRINRESSVARLLEGGLEIIESRPSPIGGQFVQSGNQIYLELSGFAHTWDSIPADSELYLLNSGGIERVSGLEQWDEALVADEGVFLVAQGDEPLTRNLMNLDAEETGVLASLNLGTASAAYWTATATDTHFFRVGHGLQVSDGEERKAILDDIIPQAVFLVGEQVAIFGMERPYSAAPKTVFATTDGTPNNLHRPIAPEDLGFVSDVASIDGNLVILNDFKIWLSEGLDLATRLADWYPDSKTWRQSSNLVRNNEGVYFFNNDWSVGESLWRTDGTQEGTYKILDLKNVSSPRQLVVAKEELHFVVKEFDEEYQVFKTDGSVGQQQLVLELKTEPTLIGTELGLFLTTQLDNGKHVLMNADLEELADLGESYRTSDHVTVGNEIYFLSTEEESHDDAIKSLWKTDGTPEGTKLLFRRRVFNPSSHSPPSSTQLVEMNGMIYFRTVNHDDRQGAIWATDGTNEHTYVYELTEPQYWPVDMVRFQDQLLFNANHDPYGTDLWTLTDPRPIVGDINEDGEVGIADFLQMSVDFGKREDGLASDLDGDGDVDFQDYLEFSKNYGKEKPVTPESALAVVEPQRVELPIMEL